MNQLRLNKVFLSYSSRDRDEVQEFHTELRRRGVPVWWDSINLPRGREIEAEVARAAREAAGFAFYLTSNAAASAWVRETERRHALANQRRDDSFGIFPVFREPIDEVKRAILAAAEEKDRLDDYDLAKYHGFVIDLEAGESLAAQLRRAAAEVLRSLLRTLAERAPSGALLRVGAATRGGPRLRAYALDLLLDWSGDFPGDQGAGRLPSPPGSESLLQALQDLRHALAYEWPGHRLRIVPQCHLAMAFALGFLFRRNSGYDLELVNIHTGDVWDGPGQPRAPLEGFWSMIEEGRMARSDGDGIAAVLGVSRKLTAEARKELAAAGLRPRRAIEFEPSAGPGTASLSGLTGDEAHRAAIAVVEALRALREEGTSGPIHLVYAGPAPFAVLLGQQLSNLGVIRLYEWADSRAAFVPVFDLKSS